MGEKKEIYFDFQKARLMIGLGILAILVSVFLLPGLFKFFGFIVGGSIIYFARTSTSTEVQLVFDDGELYIGYDSKKTYKREKIKSLRLKSEKVDFRTMEFLEVTRYVTVRGKRQTNQKDYATQYLNISTNELNSLITDFMVHE